MGILGRKGLWPRFSTCSMAWPSIPNPEDMKQCLPHFPSTSSQGKAVVLDYSLDSTIRILQTDFQSSFHSFLEDIGMCVLHCKYLWWENNILFSMRFTLESKGWNWLLSWPLEDTWVPSTHDCQLLSCLSLLNSSLKTSQSPKQPGFPEEGSLWGVLSFLFMV
jgi:hypothetical protein